MSRLVVYGGAVVDVEEQKLLPDRAIAVEQGRIAWIDSVHRLPSEWLDAPRLVAEQSFVIPGLVDAHLHMLGTGVDSLIAQAGWSPGMRCFAAIRSAWHTLASGVVAARDVGGFDYLDVALRDSLRKGYLPGPRLQVAGKFICQTGGHLHYMGREADGRDDVRRAAREQIKAGADLIKLVATGGGATPGQDLECAQLSVEEMAAAVEVAHQSGRRVAVHAHGSSGIRNSILAGVDSIEHCSCLTQELAEMMAQRGVYMVTTLADPDVQFGSDEFSVRMGAIWEQAHRSIQLAARLGVRIAAGSDAGGNAYAPHGHFAGQVESLVQRAGLSTWAALRAATVNAADLLGWSSELGRLRPGMAADMVILADSPVADISALRQVREVVFRGQLVSRMAPAGTWPPESDSRTGR